MSGGALHRGADKEDSPVTREALVSPREFPVVRGAGDPSPKLARLQAHEPAAEEIGRRSVTQGEPGNPTRNRKSGLGHSSPTGARVSVPSKQSPCPRASSAGQAHTTASPRIWRGPGVGDCPGLLDSCVFVCQRDCIHVIVNCTQERSHRAIPGQKSRSECDAWRRTR